MAGGWGHLTDDEGRFRMGLIENLGDAAEALEECYGMVWLLANGDPAVVADAAARYREGLVLSPTPLGSV